MIEAVTDPYRWLPAGVLATAAVVGILRVMLRYDRYFVRDAGVELDKMRAELAKMRSDLATCTESHAYAERQINALSIEVAGLRRQMGEP